MKFAQAIEHLYALGPELATAPGAPRRKFDLAHMRTLCAALGNPQTLVPSVLIAGTNGKGSTAATLASILVAAGYRTALYTSPHLVHVSERIQTAHPVLPSEYGSITTRGADGLLALQPISEEDFAALYTRVDEACETLLSNHALPISPSFFERLTAVAFLYFAGFGSTPPVEIMVLEVGLGGRLDATNVVEPLFSVITDIALDHQEYLGETLTEIAGEKCGILRQGGVLITLSQHPEANQAIGLAATSLNVRAINASAYLPPAQRNADAPFVANASEIAASAPSLAASPLSRNRYSLTLGTEAGNATLLVDSPLPGQHQQRNIALAIASAIEVRNKKSYLPNPERDQFGYNITNAAIEEGIRTTQWPGRLEFLPPNLLLDVAHNPAGTWTLRSAIASLPQKRPRTLIFSCLRDKSLEEMSRILFPLFDSSAEGDPMRHHDHIILVPIASPRATPMDDLLDAARALGIPAHAAPHAAGALMQAKQITPADGLIIATGSVYLIGEIREQALHAVVHA